MREIGFSAGGPELMFERRLGSFASMTPARWRLLVLSFSVLVGGFHVALIVLQSQSQLGFAFSDWLINYEGGFSRRGLPGSIMLTLDKSFDLTLPLQVVAAQATLAVVGSYLWARLFIQLQPSLIHLGLMIFPLGLAFPVSDFAAAGRKELLVGLIFLAMLNQKERTPAVVGLWSISLALVLVALSHEGLIFLMGPVVIALILKGHSASKAILVLTPAISAVALLALFTEPSTSELCEALRLRGLKGSVCNSSIAFLDWSVEENLRFTAEQLANPMFVIHGLLMICSLIWICAFIAKTFKLSPLLARSLFLSTVFTFPLYLVGIDWGRWASATYLGLIFIYSLFSQSPKVKPAKRASSAPEALLYRPRPYHVVFCLAVSCIPVNVVPGGHWGLLSSLVIIADRLF